MSTDAQNNLDPSPVSQVDFGYRTVALSQKQNLVNEVFDSVASSYDIMNDLMSVGVHRLWKEALLDWMAPRPNQILADLAGGTGDVSLKFLQRGGQFAHVIDINEQMLAAGQKRKVMNKYQDKLNWLAGDAQDIPLADNSVDRVTIAFGLRNVPDRMKALNQIVRILKPGGRFCCLEFSHVKNPLLSDVYDRWSFNVLPKLGLLVAGDVQSYHYLVESIRQFPSQAELCTMMADTGMAQIKVRSLSGGIAAIHSGWKLD
ncbi:MAG: bifunctional demethylmenaquinone methyltransferase/2-methoxy-6-polyprenyl-1,4-benzoquinol methylase UbiE [Alphaproteobacteria bacterium]|jgi:demethylmenaquinone methyltransferase / 2-methoxy-6-polyprenyl-1,4-benzoquinol methylase|nr:bifunctional demethylmenaquinone methyltransferase/2-methoxy-6-polyprenyl-1,4-benzoquinol methylase UbiE [Alphaproteobacteria bacterium]